MWIIKKRRAVSKPIMATIIALTLAIVFAALPASATGSGQGVFVLYGKGVGSSPPCGEFYADPHTDLLTIAVNGSWTVTGGGNTDTYNGPARITVDNPGTFYANPAGTHGSDVNCSTVKLEPVAVRVAVTTPASTSGSVSCALANGTFERVNAAVEVVWAPTCSVNDGDADGAAVGSVNLSVEGTSVGCPPFVLGVDRRVACLLTGADYNGA